MNLKNIITEIYQRSGLWFINLIANSAHYSVNRDVSYGKHSRQKLDYYQLEGEGQPTILFFYGGNWRSGRKQDYQFVADSLAAAGFNVVVSDYRLYPLVRFGDIRDDAIAALEKTCELIGDSELFVMGHSAGAQLAALLTLNSSLSEQSKNIRGLIGLSGPYDFYPFTDDDHWDLFGPVEDYANSQAVNFVTAAAPPIYLLHGEDDVRVRRGHSKSLMEKQLEAGGIAMREVYSGMGHADLVVAFSRLHREKSDVIPHITAFINQQVNPVNDYQPKEAQNGA